MRRRWPGGRGLAVVVVLNLVLIAATAAYVLHQQQAGGPFGSRASSTAPTPAPRPVARVDPDRVLAALDPDTRRTLRRLLEATDRPLDHGGAARLSQTLRREQADTTTRRRIVRALHERTTQTTQATRRLTQVADALADKHDELGRAVDATSTVAGVLARRDTQLRAALHELPSVLRTAQTALGHTADLAAALQPTVAALRPLAGTLGATVDALQPFMKQTTPVLQRQFLPFAEQTPSALRRLRSAARAVADRAPDATATLQDTNRATNLLAYNPPGAEQGYLFWSQWLTQLAPWIFTTQNGRTVVRSQALVTCSTLTQLTAAGRVSPTAAQTAGAFDNLIHSGLCPKAPGKRGASR